MTIKGRSQQHDSDLLDRIALIVMEIRELERHVELTENLSFQQKKRIQELEKKRQALIEEMKGKQE